MDADQKYILAKQAELQDVPLFTGLDKAELEQVCQTAKLRRLGEDEYYFFQGLSAGLNQLRIPQDIQYGDSQAGFDLK